ncbi:pancreas/duodenum homeobox protein 1 [Desulfonatronospira sp.]|uniref:pancreas/duodenum homeobox protein 1 n=1 Tax=Desulfonatronospira sp. TaxID=1962951 RepID=UPI0025B92338|nr:pancreas/duodenum homeobox protein 1 [Desulfonatronospira sp.]
MNNKNVEQILTPDVLQGIFPPRRANDFFEALYGDPHEGAFDIELGLAGQSGDRVDLEFRLRQRPGKCMACNLTYGLPQVFNKHPVIDLPGLMRDISSLLPQGIEASGIKLGNTREVSSQLHVIPLSLYLSRQDD